VLIAGIVVGKETILVVLTLLATGVVGIVETIVVVALGNAVDTTVPFGYWQPHKIEPLGQEPTLWTTAPAGQVTSDGEMQEVKFAAYDNEAKSKSNTTTKLFMHSTNIIIIKKFKKLSKSLKGFEYLYNAEFQKGRFWKILATAFRLLPDPQVFPQ